jgi:hypothetical protein
LDGTKETRIDDQFLFLSHSLAYSILQLKSAERILRSLKFDGGVKGFEQRQAPHIPNKNVTTVADNLKSPLQDSLQILGVGKVLCHRIQNDGLESTRPEAAEIVRGPF